MTFSPTWFNHTVWIWIISVLYAIILFATSKRALTDLRHTQRLPIAVVALILLWFVQATIDIGYLKSVGYHLIGMNILSLMLGSAGALWLGSAWLLLYGCAWFGVDFVHVFALNACCIIVPACSLNALARHIGHKYLPAHLFIYIFIFGFLTGAAGMMLTGFIVREALLNLSAFDTGMSRVSLLPLFLLLSWGEAFLSGIWAAVCIAFKPEWLATFNDAVYLAKHPNKIWTD